MRLVQGYGGVISPKTKKGTKEKVFSIEFTEECCKSIWNVARCKAKYMSKRFFLKGADDKYFYNGCSNVVVSKNTPMMATYKTVTQKVTLSFYVQRYDLNDHAMDLPLQSRLNQD